VVAVPILAVCTMIIEGLLKEERTGSTLHERVEARQRVIAVGKDSLGGRPLVLVLATWDICS
jgi:hypothetical protein